MEQNQDVRLASRLERTSHALEILTVVLVLLLSPLSFVLSVFFNIAPQTWLAHWSKYVFIYIVLAICIALAGFAAATSYRVRAATIRRTIQKR